MRVEASLCSDSSCDKIDSYGVNLFIRVKGMKVCIGCRIAKPPEGFYKHRGHADGLSSRCQSCALAYNNQRYHEVVKHDPAIVEKRRQSGAAWYRSHAEQGRENHRRNHRLAREQCIEAYGGRCACCGESRYEFMSIDHINGGGRQHIATAEVGGKLARWLVRKEFPLGFRVLCHNCNQSLGHYGYCPHANA